MKKIASIFIIVSILVMSLSFSAFAENTVNLSLTSEKVYAGSEFTLNLFISDNSRMSGAVIDINYDKEKIEFISAKEGAILDPNANISIRNINKDNSYVRFTYMAPSSSVTSEGVLMSVTFKALGNAFGETDLSITIPSAGDFVTQDLEKISYTVNNSKITILNNSITELSSEEETNETETTTDLTETRTELDTQNTVDDDNSDDNKDNNDIILTVILLVAGLFIICFGIILAAKKKKA